MKKRNLILCAALCAAQGLAASAYAVQPTLTGQGINPLASSAMPNGQVSIMAMLQSGDIRAQQLIVKYKHGAASQLWQSVLANMQVANVSGFYQPSKFLVQAQQRMAQWQLITFGPNTNLGDAFKQLLNDPQVEYVVPNYRFTQNKLPNDLDEALWGLNNSGQTGGKSGADIEAQAGWDYITDARDVLVAVIDTGIDYTHPELQNNIWTNPGEIAGNGIDDDNNGYIDDVHGYDFADKDSDPIDVAGQGHGTHVAGTIAAQGNNGTGVVGVAWNAKLMAVKIFGDEDQGAYTSDIVNGIVYAADMGAKVSNNSWGAKFSSAAAAMGFDKPLIEAIEYADEAGMLFVASAGNGSENIDTTRNIATPAGIELPNVLSVAASDHNDQLAGFSEKGITGADIAAPGVAIYSTLPDNNYASYNGTSMAAPHVTGAAALLFAQLPDLTPGEARALIVNSAEPVADMQGLTLSNGRLNLARLLAYAGEATTTGGSCAAFSATPIGHFSASRASYCAGQFINMCAKGSNEAIGTSFQQTSVTLYQTGETSYSLSDSCTGEVAVDLPPVLNTSEPGEISIARGGSYSLPSVSATDREDGDISASIIMSGSVDTETAGEYHIRYQVQDASGQMSVPQIQVVNVYNYDRAPEMSLLGKHCLIPLYCFGESLALGDDWQEPGYFAWDVIDGDLTDSVTSSADTLDNTREGYQTVHYDVVDASGYHWPARDKAYRVVAFLDPVLPYIYFANPFGPYDFDEDASSVDTYRRAQPEGFTPRFELLDLKDINLPHDERIEPVIDSNVQLDQVGSYEVSVTATDSDANSRTGVQIVNVIEDVTPPVATLYGDAVIDVEIGTRWFYDPLAAVRDDLDRRPVFKVDNRDVDLNVEGSQVISYTPVDGAGNVGTAVIRTVNVVRSHWDHSPRVITSSAPDSVGSTLLSGEVFDIDGDLVRVEAQIDQQGEWFDLGELSYLDEHTQTFSSAYTSEPGVYALQLRGIDAKGNVSDVWAAGTFRIKLSNNGPSISNLQAMVDGFNVTVTGNISDVDNNLQSMRVYVRGTAGLSCSGLENFTCTGAVEAPGEYIARVFATDSDGNRVSRDISYEVVEASSACITDTLANHAAAGPVYISNTLYYATGSAAYLGSSYVNGGNVKSLQETSPDYWEVVSSCP